MFGKFTTIKITSIIAVFVVLFGAYLFNSGFRLFGSKNTIVENLIKVEVVAANSFNQYRIPTDYVTVGKIKDDKQYIEITMDDTRFSPAVIVIQSGVETEITINATKLSGSNSTLIFPVYYAEIDMKEGENPIFLIPEVDFDFSTIDNSFSAYVKVVEDLNEFNMDAIKDEVKDYSPTRQDISLDDGDLPSCH